MIMGKITVMQKACTLPPFFWFLPMSNLQSSYNLAHDWKQNTGAGILDSNMVNGVKTVNGTSAFHPVAHKFMNLIFFS
ncbi:hypothetical protein VP01_2991g3 [Puccinia sorghi]|uniref:Uncharacterized protein n=1 Tax=Puccinia sorghi TaxID=27349 RepID=A0A0L6V280_9BASI|nr:hypothetical protein VP01_2991g3 [Puccinia sorghi]